MARFLRTQSGLTLVEILIATVLVSVILGSVAVSYATALKFFNTLPQKARSMAEANLAMEYVTRKIPLANQVVVSSLRQQMSMRWDFRLVGTTFVANNTPADFSDDMWIKFAFIAGQREGEVELWREFNPASPDPNVAIVMGAGRTEEVQAGLDIFGDLNNTVFFTIERHPPFIHPNIAEPPLTICMGHGPQFLLFFAPCTTQGGSEPCTEGERMESLANVGMRSNPPQELI